jgi:hypothetical protein
LKEKHTESYEGEEDEEDDLSSYWKTLGKSEDIGN